MLWVNAPVTLWSGLSSCLSSADTVQDHNVGNDNLHVIDLNKLVNCWNHIKLGKLQLWFSFRICPEEARLSILLGLWGATLYEFTFFTIVWTAKTCQVWLFLIRLGPLSYLLWKWIQSITLKWKLSRNSNVTQDDSNFDFHFNTSQSQRSCAYTSHAVEAEP